MHKKDETTCSAIEIEINGAHDHVFVDRKDVLAIMQKNGAKKGEEISQINLRGTEDQLERNAWVKKAELFFDNNQVLHAIIEEREPLARIFTLQGNSGSASFVLGDIITDNLAMGGTPTINMALNPTAAYNTLKATLLK